MITILHSVPSILTGSQNEIKCRVDNVLLESTGLSSYWMSILPDTGSIIVANDHFYFFNHETNQGFSIPYPSILLHAISRQNRAPHEDKSAIYMQIDAKTVSLVENDTCILSGGVNSRLDENGDVVDETIIGNDEEVSVEMYLFTPLKEQVDEVFQAMSECAALHPDENNDNADNDTAARFDAMLDNVLPSSQNGESGNFEDA